MDVLAELGLIGVDRHATQHVSTKAHCGDEDVATVLTRSPSADPVTLNRERRAVHAAQPQVGCFPRTVQFDLGFPAGAALWTFDWGGEVSIRGCAKGIGLGRDFADRPSHEFDANAEVESTEVAVGEAGDVLSRVRVVTRCGAV